MNTWGRHVWTLLHILAMFYPEHPDKERQESFSNLIYGICDNLPCSFCSGHCSSYLEKFPPVLNNRETLIKWVCDFHNSVNERVGKRTLSYDESEQAILEILQQNNIQMELLQRKKKNNYHIIVYIILIVIIFLLLGNVLYIYTRRNKFLNCID